MKHAHLFIGLVALAAFLGTGQYMDRFHDHLRGMDDVRRLLFRSTHIYLLLAALVNIVLGLYLTRERTRWRRIVATAGSLMLLAAPVLLLLGFATEPWLEGLERPYSRPALYGSLAGALLHLVARWPNHSRKVSSEPDGLAG